MNQRRAFPEIEHDKADNVSIVTRIDETYWGYVIRTECQPSFGLQLAQALSGVFGLASVAVAAAFWVMPGAFMTSDVLMFKAIASALLLSVGIFLLWYASAGTQPEVHIDQSRREVREVTRNRKGQSRLMGRHEFGDISEVRVESDPEDRIMGRLLLRLGNTENVIVAAYAPEHQLSVLRGRIAKDLMQAPVGKLMRDTRTDAHLDAANTPDDPSGQAERA